jgi:hypothetical protein
MQEPDVAIAGAYGTVSFPFDTPRAGRDSFRKVSVFRRRTEAGQSQNGADGHRNDYKGAAQSVGTDSVNSVFASVPSVE